MFNLIFIGTVGTIFVDTEIKGNNIIFGNVDINISYKNTCHIQYIVYTSVSQPLGPGPVPGPGINYTGPQKVLLEFVILVF